MPNPDQEPTQHIFFTLYKDVLFTAHCVGQGNALLVHFRNEAGFRRAKVAFEKRYGLSLDYAVEPGLENTLWLPTHLPRPGDRTGKDYVRTPESAFLEDSVVKSHLRFKHIEAENLDDLIGKVEAFFEERTKTAAFVTRGHGHN